MSERSMSREEVIDLARTHGITEDALSYRGPGRTEGNPDRPLAEALDYLSVGSYGDEETGEADAPTGHVARIAQYLVVTDSRGFVTVEPYERVETAIEVFAQIDRDYSKWADD